MGLSDLANASWPRVVGFSGMALVFASLTLENIYIDRSSLTLISLGMCFIGLSHASGMRSVLRHESLNGRPYEVTGTVFFWRPLSIAFAALSAILFITGAVRLAKLGQLFG